MSVGRPFIRVFFVYCCIIWGSSEKIICESEKDVYLQHNRIYFFESPNYPKGMKEGCKMKFITDKDHSSENNSIHFAATNGQLNNINIDDLRHWNPPSWPWRYTSRKQNLLIQIAVDNSYKAFQSTIFVEKKDATCQPSFLSSSSSPYLFYDETEFIYLSTLSSRNYICEWFFAAPSGYKFKIEFLYTYFGYEEFNTSFISINVDDQNYVFNKQNATSLFEPYGDNLTVKYYTESKGTFQCLVSVTKLVSDIIKENCTITKHRNMTIWTNTDEDMNGYSNNAWCFINFTVPWKNELAVFANITAIKHPDILTMYYKNRPIDMTNNKNRRFYVQSKENGYGRNAFIEFRSDGNSQSLGFQITIMEQECNCGPSEIIVPCEGKHHYNIMTNKDDHFCGDLKCNFTISPNKECMNNDIFLNTGDFDIKNMRWEVLSDNKILFNSDTDNYKKYDNNRFFEVVLFHDRINILSLFTYNHGSAKFYLETRKAFTRLPTTLLNENYPLHVVNPRSLSNGTVFTIKAESTLQIFAVLISFNYDFTLYEDENMTKIVAENPMNCFYRICYYKNIVRNKTVTVYFKNQAPSFYEYVLYFRDVESKFFYECMPYMINIFGHAKNCVFSNNLFLINESEKASNLVTMMSKSSGNCEIIMYSRNSINFWTSSINNSVSIYTSTNNKKLLEFNKYNAELWSVIAMGMYPLKINIPANTSIIIDMSYERASDKPFKTIWMSGNYVNPYEYFSSKYQGLEINENFTAIFTVKDLSISKPGVVVINGQNVTFVGQTFNFTNTEVELEYKYESGYYGYLIEVEVKENPK